MIDIEKFICSLLADHPEGVAVRGDIHRALKEQGLEYKDGKIVPIEDKNELKESEDERIKKWLISQLKIKSDGTNSDLNIMIDKAIAWLEKQGEKKQKQYDIDILEKHITKDSISELAHTVIVRNGWEIVDAKEQKPIERKGFTTIPFGAFDSELIEESITIPDGCVATIEGNKIHIKKK